VLLPLTLALYFGTEAEKKIYARVIRWSNKGRPSVIQPYISRRGFPDMPPIHARCNDAWRGERLICARVTIRFPELWSARTRALALSWLH
jgi:hypothetical protein